MKTALVAMALALVALFVPGAKTHPLPDDHPVVLRATSAADDLVAALDLEFPGDGTDSDALRREEYARASYGWSYYEASWLANPYGRPDGSVAPGTNDGGLACGVMQPHVGEIRALPTWAGVVPWTCLQVRQDRVLGYRAGLRVLLELERRCGSVCGALTAYSTDLSCKPWTAAVVVKRSRVLGLHCH